MFAFCLCCEGGEVKCFCLKCTVVVVFVDKLMFLGGLQGFLSGF